MGRARFVLAVVILAPVALALFIRDKFNPPHDPSDDDADFDPRIVELGRRVGGGASFHSAENDR